MSGTSANSRMYPTPRMYWVSERSGTSGMCGTSLTSGNSKYRGLVHPPLCILDILDVLRIPEVQNILDRLDVRDVREVRNVLYNADVSNLWAIQSIRDVCDIQEFSGFPEIQDAPA